MPIGLKSITDSLNCKITTGGMTEQELSQVSGAKDALEKNIIYSVPCFACLPLACCNTGRFIYLEDVGGYRFSDGFNWTKDFITSAHGGEIWSFGCGTAGALGDGTTVTKCSPVREVSNFCFWYDIATGTQTTGAIITTAINNTSGNIWAWGCNLRGQLGDGTAADKCSPVREVSSSTNWCSTSMQSNGTFMSALKTDGTLWTWGCASSGQLGDGTTVDKCSPVREISSDTTWCQLSAGGTHSSAIKTDGSLWTWGSNTCGGLGDGTTVSKCSPVREISSSTNWCTVSNGCLHSAAIKTDGGLWAWGYNLLGRLGDGTTICQCSPVREISSSSEWKVVNLGACHTTALKTDGSLWGWGAGGCGRLGNGTTVDICSPVREITSGTNWKIISAGDKQTLSIKTDGTLWSWGYNFGNRLGDGTTVNKCSPVREFRSFCDWIKIDSGCGHASGIRIASKGFN